MYQCPLTKICVFHALTTKRAAEAAFQVLDIFLLFDAPCILQSNIGSEFTAEVICEINSEENEHSPETSVHILSPSEEKKCGLVIS